MGKCDERNRIFNFPCTDLWFCPFLQLDDGDGVRIGFVEADGEGSAAIACVVMTAFDVLRAMDVSECQVVVSFSHSAEGNILYSANTLIVPATVAAFNGEMGHEDDGKLCRIPFLHFVQQCLEEACLSLVARCFSVQQGEVLRIDVGHGNDVAYCLFFIVYLDDVLVQIHFLGCTFDVSHNVQAEVLPEAAVYLQFGAAVVVSGGDYDGHSGAGLVNVQHGVGVHLLRGGSGRGVVVDISAYHHGVGLLFGYYAGELP